MNDTLDYLVCRNASFTTGIGVTYEDEPLTIPNAKLPKFGLRPVRGVKLIAGHRLLPARCAKGCLEPFAMAELRPLLATESPAAATSRQCTSYMKCSILLLAVSVSTFSQVAPSPLAMTRPRRPSPLRARRLHQKKSMHVLQHSRGTLQAQVPLCVASKSPCTL